MRNSSAGAATGAAGAKTSGSTPFGMIATGNGSLAVESAARLGEFATIASARRSTAAPQRRDQPMDRIDLRESARHVAAAQRDDVRNPERDPRSSAATGPTGS